MSIDFQQVRELLAAIAQTDIVELSLKSDEFELTVKKGTHSLSTVSAPESAGTLANQTSPPLSKLSPSSPIVMDSAPPPTVELGWVEITSPMVGTFYRSPAPDESPFIAIGDRVNLGQTVCIIEAMKLMNEIEAEVSGQIMEIVVENSEPVEYGQVLMRVKPD
ncbi:acetyl-CoA carboxylase biotin carboxyl carrier protein [Spirulina sp. 06S082]|uniref:acetyl-CoA carboxylase biotin carboxyl carrier protein n=1 Tax=Spirulina sp. 06S082 TaxID=3110248 RepID=UPI002B213F65|nr:acetyl-CoA carboxylase biotin carboxyl carrier protein [Spirulina sp. 06S082]MEA5470946.1 acetyl-CoA carboxylase biotin carboxyl carrier protein [Spirulina sp. 06S082]